MAEEDPPRYRVERWAQEDYFRQIGVNLWRRVTFRPIKKTAAQAEAETLAKWRRHEQAGSGEDRGEA
jgi:hypothetical protein